MEAFSNLVFVASVICAFNAGVYLAFRLLARSTSAAAERISSQLRSIVEAAETIRFVTVRLQVIFYRVAKWSAVLLPVLILFSMFLFYGRYRFAGYVLDAKSYHDGIFWITVTVIVLLAERLSSVLIEYCKFLAETSIEGYFATFVPRLRSCFGLESFQKGNPKTAMIQRADEGVYGIRWIPAQQLEMVMSMLLSGFGLCILAMHYPVLSVTLFVPISVILYLRVSSASEFARVDKSLWKTKGEKTDVQNIMRYQEPLKGVQLYGIAPRMLAHIQSLVDKVADTLRALRKRLLPRDIIAVVIEALAIGWAFRVLYGELSSDAITTGEFTYYSGIIVSVFVTLESVIRNLGKQVLGMDKVADTLRYLENELSVDMTPIDDGVEAELPAEAPDVFVKNLTYGYSPSRIVLGNVSIHFPAGVVTIVAGHNGAGKTTLFNLCSKLYKTPTGAIFANGTDLATLKTNLLRNYVRHMPQNLLTIRLTVRTLLSAAADLPSPRNKEEIKEQDALMWRALELATLSDAISKLPRQLDEPLSVHRDGETDFSGGQMKKLNLSMFFIAVLNGRTRIAIFDEPLVGIDPASSEVIVRNIAGLGITVIFSTHSVEYLPDGAHVVFFDRPSQAEPAVIHQGLHAELRRTSSTYDQYCAAGRKWEI